MKSKKELYFKIFVQYCIIFEMCLIGAFIVTIIAPFFDGEYQQTIFFYLICNLLGIFILILLYARNPPIEKLLSKGKASKIAKKQIYSIIIFVTMIFFSYTLGWVFRNYIPMPIPGFYGIVFLLCFILWVIIYHKDFVQLFDIFDIYLKDQLYPDTWPAKARQYDREWRTEKEYKLSWLPRHGSPQEQNLYNELSEKDPEQARKFAVSRMDQIEVETGKKKLHL